MADAMTVAGHSLYPSMVLQSATPPSGEATEPVRPAPADTHEEFARRLYAAAQPKPEAFWAETAAKELPPSPARAPDELTIAQIVYSEAVPTRGNVEWDEPAATDVRDFHSLDRVPDSLRLPPEEAAAGERRFREAMIAAGAGPTLARELWSDALRGHQDRIETTPQQCQEKLQQRYGRGWEARLTQARELVQAAAAKCPEIVRHLEETGLGNSPDFIAKLAKRAARTAGKR